MRLSLVPMENRLRHLILVLVTVIFSALGRADDAAPTPVNSLAASTTPTLPDAWGQLHESMVADAKARADKIQIVLLGDSITRRWTTGAGKPIYEKRYAPLGAINLGISSDGTQHVLWRLQHGVLDALHPKMVLLLIGTNNLSEEPEAVAYGVWSIVNQIRTTHPETRVLVEAIFPRTVLPNFVSKGTGPATTGPASYGPKIPLVNQLLAKLDDGKMVRFIDFGAKFLKSDGSFDYDNFPDGTHPEKPGPFEIWADSVQPFVDEWLKEPPIPNVPPPPCPVAVPTDLVSSTPDSRNDWLLRFKRQQTVAAQSGSCDLLFLGGMTMGLWDKLNPAFQKEYGAYKALNFGSTGSRTESILWELQNGGMDGLKPKLVVVQMQDNILDDTPVENVVAGMKAISQSIMQKLPGSKILLLGDFPVGTSPNDPMRQKIADYNEQLAKLADNKSVYFLDVGRSFIHPDGTLDPTPQPQPFAPAAFDHWADAQRDTITSLMK